MDKEVTLLIGLLAGMTLITIGVLCVIIKVISIL